MSMPGSPPRLDRVAGIWDPDARKLQDCGLETVDDLVVCVADQGLTALSERSQIPQDQLRTYLDLAERESSWARARRWGGVSLVIFAALTLLVTVETKPRAPSDGEAFYDSVHAVYAKQGSEGLAGVMTIIDAFLHYDSTRYDSTREASAVQALDALVKFPWREEGENGGLTPAFASLLNLGAAANHERLDSAAHALDSIEYKELFGKTERLYSRLDTTKSLGEWARANRTQAEEARAAALVRFRATISPEAVDSLLKHVTDSIDNAFQEYEERVAGQYESLIDTITKSLAPGEAAVGEALANIRALTDVINGIERRLADQARLLQDLQERLPDTIEVGQDSSMYCPGYSLLDEAAWLRDLRTHFGALESAAELVRLELQVNEAGEVVPGGVTVIPSSNPRLDTAVAESARGFVFQVPDAAESCDRLRYEILFRR